MANNLLGCLTDKLSPDDCRICDIGGKKCKQQNVVYKGICKTCKNVELEEKWKQNKEERQKNKRKNGVYVGETGRCLAEWSQEQCKGLENGERENFIIKHRVLCQPERDIPPKIEFSFIKNHRDRLSRLLHEAVLIDEIGTMNSKSEWRKNTRPRIVIENEDWEKRKKNL